MIRLCNADVEAIQAHGVRDFPYECCGVILGDLEGDVKVIRELRPMGNTFEPSWEFEALAPAVVAAGHTDETPGIGKERRYLISPDEMFQLLREERRTKRKVLGFYHSHPDHPAQPSLYDFKASHPWYTYIIVSIREGRPAEMTAWRQDTEGLALVSEEISLI